MSKPLKPILKRRRAVSRLKRKKIVLKKFLSEKKTKKST